MAFYLTGTSKISGKLVVNEPLTLKHILTRPSPESLSLFGHSVAATDTYIAVGAYNDDVAAPGAGAVYVYDANTGNILYSISEPVPNSGAFFGFALAITDQYLVIGARSSDIVEVDSGGIYVYNTATGALIHSISNPTPFLTDLFGHVVSISGTKIAVGAPLADAGAVDAGAVYIFDAITGNLIQTITNPFPGLDDRFGNGVAITNDYVAIGAPLVDTEAVDSGRVYIYDTTNWNLIHTILNPTLSAGDYFGHIVAAENDKVVVAARLTDIGAIDSGAAYIFDATSGSLLHSLSNPSPAIDDRFGVNVAISGNRVVVGAVSDDFGALDTGIAYVYNASSGKLQHTLVNPFPGIDDRYGTGVAVSANIVAVGAPLVDTASVENSGAVYIYRS